MFHSEHRAPRPSENWPRKINFSVAALSSTNRRGVLRSLLLHVRQHWRTTNYSRMNGALLSVRCGTCRSSGSLGDGTLVRTLMFFRIKSLTSSSHQFRKLCSATARQSIINTKDCGIRNQQGRAAFGPSSANRFGRALPVYAVISNPMPASTPARAEEHARKRTEAMRGKSKRSS